MPWELTGDLETFAAAAGGFLRSRPVRHTTLLTLVDTLRRRGLRAYGDQPPIFGSWLDPDGVVAGALLQTPPHPVYFSDVPPAAVPAAVAALAGRTLPGVNLPAHAVDAFADRWRARTGAAAAVRMRTRLYRLGTLSGPDQPAVTRPARPADRPLLIAWLTDFLEYIGEPGSDVAGAIDDKLAGRLITLAGADGVPAAMAVRSTCEAGVVRIQYVYTPPPFRGRGYAGSATAAAVRDAHAAGAREVVLVADLDNPISNGLYQRLGFRPIEDRTVVVFR